MAHLWISAGSVVTNYTVIATHPNASNIYDTAQITVIFPEIMSIDTFAAINKPLHHTELYRTNALVLRRGDPFSTHIELSAFDGNAYEVSFYSVDTFDGVPMTNDIPVSVSDLDNTQWYCKFISEQPGTNGSVLVEMEIRTPVNECPMGEHEFFARLSSKSEGTVYDVHDFPDVVIMLFNPWNADDAVYLSADTARQEYVMNQKGQIWMGRDVRSKAPKDWTYAQFEDCALSVLLSELRALSGATQIDTLNRTTRCIPVRIARHLSARVNSNDGGILQGNWSGSYPGGTDPLDWQGSDEILKQYNRTENVVKYGQCWVFAGTLTTLLRSAGIPSRPVTNYNSAHDTNGDGIIDVTLNFDYSPNNARSIDSVWNYHVWSEAWMQRPARGVNYCGWQVVDATPQEKSEGTYQCGPAAVSAVKLNLGGTYDNGFVRAEVNARFRMDVLALNGRTVDDHLERTDYIGKDISTKAIGCNDRDDITTNYK